MIVRNIIDWLSPRKAELVKTLENEAMQKKQNLEVASQDMRRQMDTFSKTMRTAIQHKRAMP